MIDFSNAIITEVAAELAKTYPDMPVYSDTIPAPPSLPCVALVEIDNYTTRSTLDSSGKENHADVMWQVDVYSNLSSGRKTQCMEILNIIDNKLREMGFTRIMREQTPNPSDTTIYRVTARYQARISKDFVIFAR